MELTNLDTRIKEMAARIRELREVEGISAETMAEKTGVSVEEYLACENGESDLNFAFLYKCAAAFSVDLTSRVIEDTINWLDDKDNPYGEHKIWMYLNK